MASVARLTRWEWFKLRHRWMPWILLAILLLFSQLGIWATYFNYRQLSSGGDVFISSAGQAGANGRPQTEACATILAQPPSSPPAAIDPAVFAGLRAQCAQLAQQRAQQLPQIYSNFTLPGSITQALTTASTIGLILIAVLGASTIGVEYGWGTMRTTLVRGTGRWQYLTGKLLLLALVALGALLVATVASVVSSFIAHALVAAPPGFTAPGWDGALSAIVRDWSGMLPMIALVALVSVLASSSATGMAVGIGYYIAEPIVILLLNQVSSRVGAVSDYLLASNLNGWIRAARFNNGAPDTLTSLHHFIVLLIYTVVFVGLAAWLIESRDVTKATGT